MTKPLLIEIGVEELPAIPFLKELPNIEKKWAKILEQNNLLCNFDFFYTPRRLVFWHREFLVQQEDSQKEMFGAPLKIAYKDGEATQAALSFAKKCGVDVSELSSVEQSKGPVLYYKKEIKGARSTDLLDSMIKKFIDALDFGKSMRWGSHQESFIRPIKNLSVVLGEELVKASLFGVESKKSAFGHRMVSYEPFEFDFAGEYFCKLDKNAVVLYQDERKKRIQEQMQSLEDKYEIHIEKDKELLAEIVAITEYPTALLGEFDKEFLALPPEVIVTSMKEHQRYFAVYDKQGKLSNKFIVVSNAKTDNFDAIVAGNEKVLRPRLADGMFFYTNDLENGLSNEGLKNIVFAKDLGSLYDKTQRELRIALSIAQEYGIGQLDLLQKAVELSKADLLSEMVNEFTELQGLMGYYYAKEAGEDEQVYTALKEQYLPNKEQGALPSTPFSAVVALAFKLDNLMALFSIGKIPTGSKDPYGLRRAASGVVRIAIEHQLSLDFEKIITECDFLYQKYETKKLMDFFVERLYKIFPVNPSIVKAVLGSGEKNIYTINQKIQALTPIVNSDDYKEYSATFNRVANIIKDVNMDANMDIDSALFENSEESRLFEEYLRVVGQEYKSYEEELDALFGLKEPLDKFFDNVFVNHENEAIKTNRKHLVALVYQAFKNIADIKEITI